MPISKITLPDNSTQDIRDSRIPSATSSDDGMRLVVNNGEWSVGLGAGTREVNDLRRLTSSGPLYRYKLCGYTLSRKILPLVVTNQTSSDIVDKTPTTGGIDPALGLVYYDSNVDVTSTSVNVGDLYSEHPMVRLRYTFNDAAGVRRDVFLKGTYDASEGLFYLDTTTVTSWYLSIVNTSNNTNFLAEFTSGYYYMYVGYIGENANYLHLKYSNPLYYFNGSRLVPANLDPRNPKVLTGSSAPSSSLGDDGDIYLQI